MGASEKRLIVNESKVAARVMDGEAVIIDLATGLYYSMDGVGCYIWELIECGHGASQIAGALALRYVVEPGRARTDLDALVAELLAQGLVTECDGHLPSLGQDSFGQPLEYAPPELHTYHDMGDLLALDPPMPGLPATNWQQRDEDGADRHDP